MRYLLHEQKCKKKKKKCHEDVPNKRVIVTGSREGEILGTVQ